MTSLVKLKLKYKCFLACLFQKASDSALKFKNDFILLKIQSKLHLKVKYKRNNIYNNLLKNEMYYDVSIKRNNNFNDISFCLKAFFFNFSVRMHK